MRRVITAERVDWRDKARDLGFVFHSPGGETYWDERAYWALTLEQIVRDLEAPTAELDGLCLELASRAVNDEVLLERLGLPRAAWDVIRRSWQEGPPSLYGRMDLAYDGNGPAKLLEYNADTPTALYEAAVFQWHWLEDMIAAGGGVPGRGVGGELAAFVAGRP
jgi:glutathionylspermidine synthase